MSDDANNNRSNSRYTAACGIFIKIKDKFDSSFGKKILNDSAAAALKNVCENVENISNYRDACRLIAQHQPIRLDDEKLIKDALKVAFSVSITRINEDIKGFVKEINDHKRQVKSDELLGVHGMLHRPNWVSMGGKDGLAKLDTLTNTEALIKAMGISVRYNAMTRQTEFVGGIAEGRESSGAVIRIISAGKSQDYKSKDIIDHIEEIGLENQYHPVAEWMRGIEWDGIDRISALSDTLVSDMDAEMKKTFLLRWSVGAAKVIIEDTPPPLQVVLVLQGAQSIGKTTWLRSLCPVPNSVLDGVELNPHNVDSVRKATGAWIVELGELDATFKREIASLKAFLTLAEDIYREPYARVSRRHARRTAFTASVNPDDYLVDPTGNRRWLTIPVTRIKPNTIDMQQFWAQVFELAAEGVSHSLSPAELAWLNGHNQSFEQGDTYKDMILKYFGHASEITEHGKARHMNATEVAEYLGYQQPDNKIIRAIGSAMRSCGYKRKTIGNGAGKTNGYLVLPTNNRPTRY